MSDTLTSAVEVLAAKMDGSDFSGSAKFDIIGVGTIVVDGSGARAADEDTDVTLSAEQSVFEDMMNGDLDPTSAYMTGKLTIEGSLPVAMQLAGALS